MIPEVLGPDELEERKSQMPNSKVSVGAFDGRFHVEEHVLAVPGSGRDGLCVKPFPSYRRKALEPSKPEMDFRGRPLEEGAVRSR